MKQMMGGTHRVIIVLLLALALTTLLSAFLGYRLLTTEPPVAAVSRLPLASRRVPSLPLKGEGDPASPAPDTTTPPAVEAPAAPVFDWNTVESDDYAGYISKLRGIGCPEQTIRDMVIADVNKLYASRRGEMKTGGGVSGFWQSMPELPDEERTFRDGVLAELEQERKDLIRSLLGVDPLTEALKQSEGFTYPENRLGNLTVEQQEAVSLIRERHNENWFRAQQEWKAAGTAAEVISDGLRRMGEAHIERLGEILSPEEIREHELQTSWTALQMRNRHGGFWSSGAEFEAVYDLQKAFDNEYIHYFGPRTDPVDLAEREAAYQQLQLRIRETLGEQRYHEYLNKE